MTKYTLLRSIAPSIASASELPVEDLAYALLDHIRHLVGQRPVHAGNLFLDLATAYDAPLHEMRRVASPNEVRKWKLAFAEAIGWLEAHMLLVRYHESNYMHFDLTERALSLNTEEMFRAFVRGTTLSREALHPIVAENAWPSYIRGHFDTAVFEAFKAVEVAVRDAGGFSASDYGRELMTDAFNEKGPLRDPTIPKAERESIMMLFSGAIGAFKNPTSHRQIGLDDPKKAAELMMLASHLMSIVDDAVVRRQP